MGQYNAITAHDLTDCIKGLCSSLVVTAESIGAIESFHLMTEDPQIHMQVHRKISILV